MISDEERSAFQDSVEGVAKAAQIHIRSAKGATAAVDFVANLHRSVDVAVEREARNGPPVACRAGCSYCCVVRVEATEAELFRIVREVKTRPEAEIDILRARLEARVAADKVPDSTTPRSTCPFLEKDLCSIYEVRPAACRKAHSLSADQCRDRSPKIPQNLAVLVAAEALMNGVARAYRDTGLGASAHELCGSVLAALDDGTLEAKWYGGDAVFPEVAGR